YTTLFRSLVVAVKAREVGVLGGEVGKRQRGAVLSLGAGRGGFRFLVGEFDHGTVGDGPSGKIVFLREERQLRHGFWIGLNLGWREASQFCQVLAKDIGLALGVGDSQADAGRRELALGEVELAVHAFLEA